jgi:hypothetical protein
VGGELRSPRRKSGLEGGEEESSKSIAFRRRVAEFSRDWTPWSSKCVD